MSRTTHGNLPKLGSFLPVESPLLTTVAYQHSVSGNLGTHFDRTRLDRYGATRELSGAAVRSDTSRLPY